VETWIAVLVMLLFFGNVLLTGLFVIERRFASDITKIHEEDRANILGRWEEEVAKTIEAEKERDKYKGLLAIEAEKVESVAKLANETLAEKNAEIEALKNVISEHATGLQAALEKHDEPKEE
jgi:hypothetical protein